jgi:hypothetical protein
VIAYCSEACQKEAWGAHKRECGSIRSLRTKNKKVKGRANYFERGVEIEGRRGDILAAAVNKLQQKVQDIQRKIQTLKAEKEVLVAEKELLITQQEVLVAEKESLIAQGEVLKKHKDNFNYILQRADAKLQEERNENKNLREENASLQRVLVCLGLSMKPLPYLGQGGWQTTDGHDHLRIDVALMIMRHILDRGADPQKSGVALRLERMLYCESRNMEEYKNPQTLVQRLKRLAER